MFGGEGEANGSSIRSTSNGYRAKTENRSRATRVPEWCGCGCRPVLRWSGTHSNPNKPFFGCPNYNTIGKRWCGLFVWADVGQEAVPAKSESLNYNEEQKMTEGWRLEKLESDVRSQKFMIKLLFVVISVMLLFLLVVFCKL
ncbi:hypothetical protein Ahy_B08g090729 [Arachis hypogaea]|uniref:Zinc finger GRF-type domain-containing protein n=1 Tax=Arachis hypogaea TaxID=3818 RepID=A0A444Y0I5_ARAHY|nr:hypothetical protein Ahy_B08g090729 [Arachis hypogaea]